MPAMNRRSLFLLAAAAAVLLVCALAWRALRPPLLPAVIVEARPLQRTLVFSARVASRSRVMRTVLSSTFAGTLGSSVWIRRARQGRKGATRSTGPAASSARHRSTRPAGTARGMILTVATICLGSTTACSGSVASVTASSIRLKRSTRARSSA